MARKLKVYDYPLLITMKNLMNFCHQLAVSKIFMFFRIYILKDTKTTGGIRYFLLMSPTTTTSKDLTTAECFGWTSLSKVKRL